MNPIYDITLLGFVSQPAHFIVLGGVESPVEHRELVVVPAEHPEKKALCFGLLFPP